MTNTSPDSGSVKISYNVLGVGLLVLAIFILILYWLDCHFNLCIKLSDYISLCSFGCVTIGLIYNAISLQYNYSINKQKFEQEAQLNDQNKIRLTYEIISDWYKADMAMNAEISRRIISPYKGKLKNPTVLEEFISLLKKEESLTNRKSLISVLNYFEHLSLLINDNVVDEKIIKNAFRTLFVTYYDNLKDYIEDEQRGNNGSNSKVYINFVNLSLKWLKA